MLMARFYLLAFILLVTLGAFKANTDVSAVVSGKVLSAADGKPVANAHVFIVHGEEEALTGSDGRFRIETWQKLPVKLQVQHKSFQSTSVSVSDPNKPVVIRLSPGKP